jgi:hypothetical protein
MQMNSNDAPNISETIAFSVATAQQENLGVSIVDVDQGIDSSSPVAGAKRRGSSIASSTRRSRGRGRGGQTAN